MTGEIKKQSVLAS